MSIKKKTDNEFDILNIELDEKEHRAEESENEETAASGPVVWRGSGDMLLINQAMLFPEKLPFIALLLENAPELLPDGDCVPGTVECLIYRHVLKMTEESSAPKKDTIAESIRNMWYKAGGKDLNV